MPPRRATLATGLTLERAYGSRPFTSADALAAGITRRQLQCAVRAGTLRSVGPRLYSITDTADPGSTLLRLQTELRRRGVPAVVGGRSAADLWGIPVLGHGGPLTPPPLTLWIPPGTQRPGERGGVHYRVESIPPDHTITRADGLVVTTPLRTAIDVVRLARLPRRLALASIVGGLRVATALHLGLEASDAAAITHRAQVADLRHRCTEELRRIAAECPHWGLNSVRACIDVADLRLETALESLSWGRFLDAGIPLPTPQAWLAGASGRWWRVDFWWAALGIIGEADGMVKYTDRRDLTAEKDRQLDLEGAGWSVHRWGWRNALRDGDPLMASFLDRLRRAA